MPRRNTQSHCLIYNSRIYCLSYPTRQSSRRLRLDDWPIIRRKEDCILLSHGTEAGIAGTDIQKRLCWLANRRHRKHLMPLTAHDSTCGFDFPRRHKMDRSASKGFPASVAWPYALTAPLPYLTVSGDFPDWDCSCYESCWSFVVEHFQQTEHAGYTSHETGDYGSGDRSHFILPGDDFRVFRFLRFLIFVFNHSASWFGL